MKKKKDNIFNEYLSFLNTENRQEIDAFFANFKQHISLPISEEKKLRIDLENALMYYNAIGLPTNEALKRLSNENLGGFYARPNTLYYELDDAAKIYPLSLKHGKMNVFRISATLKDDIVPALLQIALTFTIKRFPRFATTLKKGFFWHYLDSNKQRYGIEKEEHLPCRPMNVSTSSAQSFRVLYYQKRISVEFFHSLTDGRGGVVFIQTLIATYLSLFGGPKIESENILDINATPSEEENKNEFKRAVATKSSGFKDKKALQMSGRRSVILPSQIIHFMMDSGQLYNVAKSKGLSVTTYLLTIFMLCAKHATESKKGNIAIQLPVDMRKFYPSSTLANFSMYANIQLPYEDITDFNGISENIKEQVKNKTTNEKISEMMYSAHKMNRTLRFIPLFIKSPVAKIAYGFLGEALFTTTFSNIGIIKTPEEFKQHIDSFAFVLGAPQINRLSTSLITYENNAVLTLTKATKDPSFEEELYRLLTKDGINIELEGSSLYEHKSNLPR